MLYIEFGSFAGSLTHGVLCRALAWSWCWSWWWFVVQAAPHRISSLRVCVRVCGLLAFNIYIVHALAGASGSSKFMRKMFHMRRAKAQAHTVTFYILPVVYVIALCVCVCAVEAINNSWIMSLLDALVVVVIHDNVCTLQHVSMSAFTSPHSNDAFEIVCICWLPKMQFNRICVFSSRSPRLSCAKTCCIGVPVATNTNTYISKLSTMTYCWTQCIVWPQLVQHTHWHAQFPKQKNTMYHCSSAGFAG